MAGDSSLPPTWVPTSAGPRARQAWSENPLARARRLFKPDPQILDTYLPVLMESFSVDEFRYAIERHYDLLPQVEKKGALSHPLLGPLARTVIRIQWPYIFDGLTKPSVIREKIRRMDVRKAALFDTPQGAVYLNWLTFHLLWLLYDRGKIKGEMRVYPPPGVCPLHQGLCQPGTAPAVP
ncbi:MAG: hypothetical protein ACREB9_00235 [Thermoplasmata archaeon]